MYCRIGPMYGTHNRNFRVWCFKFWSFLHHFWLLTTGSHVASNSGVSLPHFWLLTIGSYVASNSRDFLLHFWLLTIVTLCFENSLKEIHSFAQSFNLRRTLGDPTWVFIKLADKDKTFRFIEVREASSSRLKSTKTKHFAIFHKFHEYVILERSFLCLRHIWFVWHI